MSSTPLPNSTTLLPLSPADSPTSISHSPSTLAFQASLPKLLQPLSPELSALYAARIRLLGELPVGSSRGWCCTKCGWLKHGFGWKVVKVKDEKGKKKVAGTFDESVGKKGRGKGKGKGRTKAGNQQDEADIAMPLQPSLLSDSALPNQSSTSAQTNSTSPASSTRTSTIGAGARIPSSNPASRNRQKSACPLCGSPISLRAPSAATKSGFLSTRRTKAIVDANAGDVSVLPMANGMMAGGGDGASRVGSKRTRGSMKQEAEMVDKGQKDGAAEAAAFESTGICLIAPPTSDPAAPSSTASGKPLIPNPIKASPKLAYIAATDPDPATEAEPSLRPSTLPAAGEDRPAGVRNAVGYVNLGPVGGATGKAAGGARGKKQSNLKTSTVVSQLATSTSVTPSAKPTAKPPTVKKPTASPTPGPPAKKKQKTGLAKLLADSKAREKETEKKKGTGLFSLDGADWEL